MRRVALLLTLGAAGCGPPPLGAEALFADLTTSEVRMAVRFPEVPNDTLYDEVNVYATITAPGAAWASVSSTCALSGVTRRATEGVIELDLHHGVGNCEAGACECIYVVALDDEPAAPWSLSVEAWIHGETPEGAELDIAIER